MRSSSRIHGAMRWFLALLAAAVAVLGMQGCATEEEGVMPWATPLPGEGSVVLPGNLMRQ